MDFHRQVVAMLGTKIKTTALNKSCCFHFAINAYTNYYGLILQKYVLANRSCNLTIYIPTKVHEK
jgi:hypothetical protein